MEACPLRKYGHVRAFRGGSRRLGDGESLVAAKSAAVRWGCATFEHSGRFRRLLERSPIPFASSRGASSTGPSTSYPVFLFATPGGRMPPISTSGSLRTLASQAFAPRKDGQDGRAFRDVSPRGSASRPSLPGSEPGQGNPWPCYLSRCALPRSVTAHRPVTGCPP